MFVANSVRAKKHNIHVHIRPDGEANTSIRPKDFMRCNGLFTNADSFIRNMTTIFENVVKNTPIKHIGGPFKVNQFEINARYNRKVDSLGVKSTTHRCAYNVIINKNRSSSLYGYNFYIYFIPKDEIASCVQNDSHFVIELKAQQEVTMNKTVERRINVTKPHGTVLPKGCQLMYKIQDEPPYFVATLEEASWLKEKNKSDFKEVMVANVAGTLFEVVGEAVFKEIDINDYTQNYIFKSKTAIPKRFKYQEYKVNKTETVYSNMLIDDAVEGVYDMVGKNAAVGLLVVVVHRSFLGDSREIIYTEIPSEIQEYKAKFMHRRKI